MITSAIDLALLSESNFSLHLSLLPSIDIRLARHFFENRSSAALSLTRGFRLHPEQLQ